MYKPKEHNLFVFPARTIIHINSLDLELTPGCKIGIDWRKEIFMTIKEVCEHCGLSADTLRYYERIGAIPKVGRTKGGIRNYTEEDLKWIQNAICLRGAGVPVEMIIEYVKLFQQGNATYEARCSLLKEAREKVLSAREKYDRALNKLNYKIEKYEEAAKTGVLIWDQEKWTEGE